MNDKRSLRRWFRQRRKQQGDVSDAIASAALELIASFTTGRIGLYVPLIGEADLRSLRRRTSTPMALPRADGEGGLTYLPWDDDDLTPDGCGIPAPATGAALLPEQLSLLLVPALAVDTRGIRLGYGGGYYDRLRADPAWAAVPAWVVLPSTCLSDHPLPKEPWDVPFDGWITERGAGRRS